MQTSKETLTLNKSSIQKLKAFVDSLWPNKCLWWCKKKCTLRSNEYINSNAVSAFFPCPFFHFHLISICIIFSQVSYIYFATPSFIQWILNVSSFFCPKTKNSHLITLPSLNNNLMAKKANKIQFHKQFTSVLFYGIRVKKWNVVKEKKNLLSDKMEYLYFMRFV